MIDGKIQEESTWRGEKKERRQRRGDNSVNDIKKKTSRTENREGRVEFQSFPNTQLQQKQSSGVSPCLSSKDCVMILDNLYSLDRSIINLQKKTFFTRLARHIRLNYYQTYQLAI